MKKMSYMTSPKKHKHADLIILRKHAFRSPKFNNSAYWFILKYFDVQVCNIKNRLKHLTVLPFLLCLFRSVNWQFAFFWCTFATRKKMRKKMLNIHLRHTRYTKFNANKKCWMLFFSQWQFTKWHKKKKRHLKLIKSVCEKEKKSENRVF